MKFPKELSPERLSLLSKEDREIYKSEHRKVSDKNSYTIFSADEIESSNITESCGTLNISEDDMNKWVESIVNEEVQKLYDELMSDVVPIDECNFQQIISDNFTQKYNKMIVFEGAEGLDAYAWIRGLKLGWLGTMAAAGLGMLGTGIAYLITAGKDKLAMEKLKYYMNRLVELTDQGVHKKRPWYSFLVPSKKARNNMGEYNMGCFRTIQESADRNMVNSVMSAAHKLGYFAKGDMMNISASDSPQRGSGLDAFKTNVLSNLNVIVRD